MVRVAERVSPDEKGPAGHEEPGAFHEQEILERDPARPLGGPIEPDESVRREGHELPGRGEAERQIVHDEQAGHAGDEEREAKIVDPRPGAGKALQIPDRVERAGQSQEGDEAEEEAGQAIEEERQNQGTETKGFRLPGPPARDRAGRGQEEGGRSGRREREIRPPGRTGPPGQERRDDGREGQGGQPGEEEEERGRERHQICSPSVRICL